MKHFALAAGLLALTLSASGQDFTHQEPIEEADGLTEFNAEKIFAEQDRQLALWQDLQESRVAEARAGELDVRLDDFQRALLEATDKSAAEIPGHLLGVHLPVEAAFDVTDWAAGQLGQGSPGAGRAAIKADGTFVWTTSVRSAGASALRLRITGFDLPKGAALYLYNDAGQAHGPYLGRGPHGSGEFWSNTVFGDTAWVQLHVAPGFAARGRLPLAFEIEKISHLGADFQLPALMAADKADCSANLDCVENAECYDWPELSAARRGVAYLNFEDESNGRTYGCTGGLLNDKDGSDRTPWLLTAAHCIDSEAEADSLEAFFQFQSDCGSCSGSSVDTVLGADLWATGSASDFSLLELSELPSSWFLMGWTNATILDNDGEVLYRISHPKGSPQSVSTHQVEGTGVTGNYILTENIFGTTEGQSSGSPIIRANRQVVGQLRGTTFPNQNLYDLCDSSTFTTRDGALSTYWKSVRPYLASPGNTYKMHVDDVRASVAPFSAFELARATVTVVDERGNGIPRVTVAGSFSGDVSGPSLGVTDDRGQALILYPTPPFGTPSFSFCVTGLSHDYFNTYDSAANAATCASR